MSRKDQGELEDPQAVAWATLGQFERRTIEGAGSAAKEDQLVLFRRTCGARDSRQDGCVGDAIVIDQAQEPDSSSARQA